MRAGSRGSSLCTEANGACPSAFSQVLPSRPAKFRESPICRTHLKLVHTSLRQFRRAQPEPVLRVELECRQSGEYGGLGDLSLLPRFAGLHHDHATLRVWPGPGLAAAAQRRIHLQLRGHLRLCAAALPSSGLKSRVHAAPQAAGTARGFKLKPGPGPGRRRGRRGRGGPPPQCTFHDATAYSVTVTVT